MHGVAHHGFVHELEPHPLAITQMDFLVVLVLPAVDRPDVPLHVARQTQFDLSARFAVFIKWPLCLEIFVGQEFAAVGGLWRKATAGGIKRIRRRFHAGHFRVIHAFHIGMVHALHLLRRIRRLHPGVVHFPFATAFHALHAGHGALIHGAVIHAFMGHAHIRHGQQWPPFKRGDLCRQVLARRQGSPAKCRPPH